MPSNEDWRYRKAQELGLGDSSQVVPPRARAGNAKAPPVREPARPAAPARPAPSGATPPPPAGPASATPPPLPPYARAVARPARTARPVALIAAIAAGLAVSVGAGWALHANYGTPQVAMNVGTPALTVPAAEQRAMTPPRVVAPPVVASATVDRQSAAPVAVLPPAEALAESPVESVAAGPAKRPPAKAVRRVAARTPVTRARAAAVRRMASNAGVRRAAPKPRRSAEAALRPGRTSQPSFDCSRAGASVNQMICNDPALAGLDVAVARGYRRAVTGRNPDTERRLDRSQAAFLNARNECQTSRCVARLYRQRLAQLRHN